VIDERRKFFETNIGFVPKSHLREADRHFSDPVTVAQLHFGVPYLWGGNSSRGIDCSGLIAAGLTACDIPCLGDSDLQRDTLGASFIGPYRRGDLVFWDGHVGMMVDEETLIHANAHHMATAYEPVERAILRIAAQDGGPVLTRKRI
jgi:cell wall-associated NlpC family hydrolase